MNYSIDKVIIRCPDCKQKLRLPLFRNKKLLVRCPKCSKEFRFDGRRYIVKQEIAKWGIVLLFIIFLIADIIMPFILISKSNVAIANVKNNYEESVKQMGNSFINEINALKNKYAEEIAKIDSDKLKEKAWAHYAKIWQERKNYNIKFAITPREKAQLEMLALAKDKTKTIEDIVKSIVIKSAPRNSEVNVYTTIKGLRLDIDFDMLELTSGEEGSRTKHLTIDSLKEEVVRLISKVTNDVYEFCQDLDLETILIGCRHFVGVHYKYGSPVDENIILYKIRLDKKDIKELKHNPFFDIYSTTKYFKIEKDDFPNLYIEQIYEK